MTFRPILSLFATLIAVMCSLSAEAQASNEDNIHDSSKLEFEVVDYKDGLFVSSVRRIYQDNDGLIWIGTNGGVLYYDGYTFKMIDGINDIVCSLVDYAGYIWVGTSNGMAKVDKVTKSVTFVVDEPFDKIRVENITLDKMGMLWVATTQGVYRFDPSTESTRRVTELIVGGDVKQILVDSKGRVWCASWTYGPFLYDIKTKKTIQLLSSSEYAKKGYSIFEDDKGNIWFGFTERGLARVVERDGEFSLKYYSHDPAVPTSLANNLVFSISQEANSGKLWVGTQYGLSILNDIDDPNSFTNHKCYIEDGNRVYDDINWIYRDKTGIMWLASLYNGILKVNPNRTYIEHNPLTKMALEMNGSTIQDIVEVDKYTYYINIKGRGVYRYNLLTDNVVSIEELFKKRGVINRAPSKKNNVTDLQYVKEKNLLIYRTIGAGYYEVKLSAGDPLEVNYTGSEKQPTLKVIVDSDLRKWVFRKNRLVIYSDSGTAIASDVFKNKQVTAYAEDGSGSMWIGTKGGDIYKTVLRDDSVKIVSTYRRLTKERYEILSLNCNDDETIWAGTSGRGLLYLDREQDEFVELNQKYNIDSKAVFNIFSANPLELFMYTYNGLIRLDLESGSTQHIYTNNQFDPVLSYSCVNDSIFLLGGINGYNRLNTNRVSINQHKPTLLLLDVKANNDSVIADEHKFKKVDSNSYSLELAKCDNNVEFSFSALNYSEPLDCTYMYKLDGIDKEWRYCNATNRSANYSNLSKGNYTFKVKATNENGIWADSPIECSLTIKPAIYETWYAYLIYLLLVILTVFSVIMRIRDRIKFNISLLDIKLQQEKAAEVNDIKLKFFTNISHELLTPLSVIRCSVEELEEGAIVNREQNRVIISNIDRLMRLIRQIIEFRKVESDNIKLKVSREDLGAQIESICKYSFESVAKQKMIHLSLVKQTDDIVGYIDTDKVDKIIHNLLSNAFKYNKTGGYVLVNVSTYVENERTYASIKVQDNGIGIDDANISAIFNRFYDGEYRQTKTTGSGIGLSLSRELARLHLGDLNVESKLNYGSAFTLNIPLSREVYADNNIEISESEDEVAKSGAVEEIVSDVDNDKETILIVEDNRELQMAMLRSLSTQYNILQAYDGVEALKIIEANNVDTIISDIMMPNMNGIELCKILKGNVNFCHIPIIMLTAKVLEDTQAEAYAIGANGYLTKPFSMRVLKSRVSNLLLAKSNLASQYKEDSEVDINLLIDNDLDKKIMNTIIEVISENIANEEFKWLLLSERLNLSQSTIYRKIKQITGMSPNDFIRNRRLKESQKLLCGATLMTIAEVAFAVGFSDPKYFSICFKKEFGVTPTQFKRNGVSND